MKEVLESVCKKCEEKIYKNQTTGRWESEDVLLAVCTSGGVKEGNFHMPKHIKEEPAVAAPTGPIQSMFPWMTPTHDTA